jgi:hypothetical protein
MEELPERMLVESGRELPERVRQTIGAEKSILIVFPIRKVSLLSISCHKGRVSLHNPLLKRY